MSGYFDSIGLYQHPTDQQQLLAEQWLSLIHLQGDKGQTPFQALSWGQQRLVLIVRALVKHPALLILDEPLQGLDPLNRQLIRRFIDIIISKGTIQLLFVSHHAEDAPECITYRLRFVVGEQGYYYLQEAVNKPLNHTTQ
ncbi:MAG: putative ABC transporter ATP-binding protein YlmA [Candidatus Erwinia impunctatus]|nr:putative ABC transporter ATP-binding protein YlmA [Culicoides impunctatus]